LALIRRSGVIITKVVLGISATTLPFQMIACAVVGQCNRGLINTLIQTSALHLRAGGISNRIYFLRSNQIDGFIIKVRSVRVINAKGNLFVEWHFVIGIVIDAIPVYVEGDAVLRTAAIGSDKTIGKITPPTKWVAIAGNTNRAEMIRKKYLIPRVPIDFTQI